MGESMLTQGVVTEANSTLLNPDTTKKQGIKEILKVATPIILVVLAGLALAAATAVTLATKTSIFKPSAKIIKSCSNVLGSAQGASVNFEAIGSVNVLDEGLKSLWHSVKLTNPELLKNISLSNAQEIRNWLNNPMNKSIIDSITKISLSDATLKVIPAEIGLFKNLKTLNISIINSDIAFLPKEIGMLRSLENLTITGTQITSLPKEIGRLRSLKFLYLSSNQLVSLPKEMGRLTSLESLYLNYNKIDGVPQGIIHLLESNGGKLKVYNNGTLFS